MLSSIRKYRTFAKIPTPAVKISISKDEKTSITSAITLRGSVNMYHELVLSIPPRITAKPTKKFKIQIGKKVEDLGFLFSKTL